MAQLRCNEGQPERPAWIDADMPGCVPWKQQVISDDTGAECEAKTMKAKACSA
jgi:hypothetical protein